MKRFDKILRVYSLLDQALTKAETASLHIVVGAAPEYRVLDESWPPKWPVVVRCLRRDQMECKRRACFELY